jgi:tRNA-dependent cyclodipeptide synthase
VRSDLDSNKSLPSVEIATILPSIPEQEVFAKGKCYIGISLTNPIFEKGNLEALLRWASDKFAECLVILGDDLCRFNQTILFGSEPDEALQAAHRIGDAFIEKTAEVFGQFDPEKMKLIRWNENLQSDQYLRSREMLDELFASDAEFKAMVEVDALSFVDRQKQRNKDLAVDDTRATELCCEYLLEEIAVFNMLSEQGWCVELYPGCELHVLAEVAKGRFPNVPAGLKNRINVELKIT